MCNDRKQILFIAQQVQFRAEFKSISQIPDLTVNLEKMWLNKPLAV